jgi:hypothetical protein
MERGSLGDGFAGAEGKRATFPERELKSTAWLHRLSSAASRGAVPKTSSDVRDLKSGSSGGGSTHVVPHVFKASQLEQDPRQRVISRESSATSPA